MDASSVRALKFFLHSGHCCYFLTVCVSLDRQILAVCVVQLLDSRSRWS